MNIVMRTDERCIDLTIDKRECIVFKLLRTEIEKLLSSDEE